MNIYIRNQEGDGVIEKGKILTIGGTKRTSLLTGDSEDSLVCLGVYKDEEMATEILNEITQRVVQPTAKEVEKGCLFIDLSAIK